METITATRWISSFGLVVLLALCAGGCAQTKLVKITAKPADTEFTIDGVRRGRGPLLEEFKFDATRTLHRVVAERPGYKPHTTVVTLKDPRKELAINMEYLDRDIKFTVQPAPAYLTIDGQPVSTEPVKTFSKKLDFTLDPRNNWTKYVVRAERENFEPAEVVVSWPDQSPNYTLNLGPKKKDVSINSTPTGASVYLDGQLIGQTPVRELARPFMFDVARNEFTPNKLRIIRPGYKDLETEIAWDDGKSAYHYDLAAQAKEVTILTEPRDARVEIDGKPITRDARGVAKARLEFLPINESGELRSYPVTVTEKHPNTGEWEPKKFVLGWDDGRSTYEVKLKEILTRPVSLLTAAWVHDGAWNVTPRVVETIGTKDTEDGPDRPKAVLLSQLTKGTNIDTLTISPDGTRVLFTVLSKEKDELRSQLFVIRTDGDGGADLFSDGKSLDLTPSYSPGGDNIVFSSNRAGRRMSIWQMAASGAPGITQLTSGEANDLWPAIDSDPKPRLYYQSMLDQRSDPRLFSAQVGNMFRTDMQTTGMQPRVSPKNDWVVFTSINEKSGKRDIFRVRVTGGSPENITGTPDIDEYDPVWNAGGTKVAYTSDRGEDVEKRRNLDIWILDLRTNEGPKQVTVNGSHDDCPAWGTWGNEIYFRSNRGGQWGIWKIQVK